MLIENSRSSSMFFFLAPALKKCYFNRIFAGWFGEPSEAEWEVNKFWSVNRNSHRTSKSKVTWIFFAHLLSLTGYLLWWFLPLGSNGWRKNDLIDFMDLFCGVRWTWHFWDIYVHKEIKMLCVCWTKQNLSLCFQSSISVLKTAQNSSKSMQNSLVPQKTAFYPRSWPT